MRSGPKRRFFDRNAAPVVATDADFEAVFGATAEQPASTPQEIATERIRPNPFQARVHFNDLEELAESMRLHGFTSRLRVRRDPAQPQFFQLVYGERRWRAAQLAGITVIPCDVAEYTDRQLREIGLTENLQRSDLAPLEEAHAFQQAMEQEGYSVRALAERIGKSKGYVQNRLDLLRTPADVQQMVTQRPDALAAALLIAQLPTPEQRRPLIEGITSRTLNGDTVRDIVRDIRGRSDSTPHGGTTDQPVAVPDAPPAGRSEAQSVDAGEVAPAATRPPRGRLSRVTRQSGRSLQWATHTLSLTVAQIKELLPTLESADRAALLDYIVQTHFPELEGVVDTLRT